MRKDGTFQKMERTKLIELYKEQKLANIEKGRNSLMGFISYTKEDYTFKWFHKLISAYLDALYEGRIKKLMIFIPPQHGKSELSSRRFPAYVLGREPRTKIAVVSYSGDLSMSFNRDCQNIIDDEKYRELFPETKLNMPGDLDAKGEIRNNHMFEIVKYRGFYKAVGIRGSLTGRPIDLGIIDDPFKDRAEANSKAIRDKVWEWYQDVFLTRLHNDSKQLLLFTRWHEDDIAGRILDPNNNYYDEKEAKEWTVIAIPALKEATKPIPQALDINDPREIEEALWEERHSREKYIRRRRINPTGFQSLDQQRPTAPEGNMIKREWFIIKNEKQLPFNPRLVTADFFIDGAFTEKAQNDETALMSCYFNNADGKLYIFNVMGVRKEMYELLKYFKKFALNNYSTPKSSVYIELKASGYPLKFLLRKIEYGGFNTRGIDNKIVALGKYNRVENTEPFLASGKVILVEGSWNKAFINQCTSFPNGSNDDMVDVLTYAVHKYFIKKSVGGVTYKYKE